MKKPPAAKKQKQPRPELAIYPQRGRVLTTLLLCLVLFGFLTATIISSLLTTDSPGTEVLFGLFYLIGTIYLLGIAWSALRMLTSKQPSFQANTDELILRHLPFLGNLTIPWSEVKSVHMARSLFFSHLCLVPRDAHQLIKRYGVLRFALNASARFGMRTSTPLSISRGALDRPVRELIQSIEKDYAIDYTPGMRRRPVEEIT